MIVAPLSQAAGLYATRRPSHVISLVSPGAETLDLPAHDPARRLSLAFHDIGAPQEGLIAPDEDDIRRLLAFGVQAGGPLLIHCWAGISRSTVAAFILACATSEIAEAEIAGRLRRASPMATPNPLMVSLADRILGREGRMTAAIAGIGRGAEAFEGLAFDF